MSIYCVGDVDQEGHLQQSPFYRIINLETFYLRHLSTKVERESGIILLTFCTKRTQTTTHHTGGRSRGHRKRLGCLRVVKHETVKIMVDRHKNDFVKRVLEPTSPPEVT